MKKIFLSIFCFLIISYNNLYAQNIQRIDSIPTTLEGFIELRDELAVSSQGGALLFMIAMMMYIEDIELGRKAFVISLDRSVLVFGDDYKGYSPPDYFDFHLKHLSEKPWIAKSYILNTLPEKNYLLPEKIKYRIKKEYYNTLIDGEFRVFIDCSGSIWEREMKVIKNNRGIWKVLDFRDIFVDVIPPTPLADDGF
ncbi:MAG: hypothetical protein MK207_10170 [Saprospiraceae bacterium]|nr:hypothetical protein [Saprospiraceae bacterium]